MYQDNYQRQTKCIDDQDKFQSVKDTDNEFTECQTPRKKFQSIGISPVSLHAFTKTLESNISEAQKVQVDWLNNSESDSYDKNYMQEKVNVLVRLQEATQEKLKTASYSEPIQFLTMVPDEWSPRHVSEYFNIFKYLHIKSKKQVKYQQILLLKIEKLSPLKHFIQ